MGTARCHRPLQRRRRTRRFPDQSGHRRVSTRPANARYGVDVGGKKVRFLRRIPNDPMTNSTDWGLRSMQDDPASDSWGGQNVFDVFTKSDGTGLDGTKYKDW